tara:strand:+ start:348 stop:704 length:357 start_codon:yes stop_codon:yes gene_type:complete
MSEWSDRIEEANILISSFMSREEMRHYHTSFDLLIPVITTIGKLDPCERMTHTYCFEIDGNGTDIYKSHNIGGEFELIRHNSRDNLTYNTFWAIVEFVNWFNTQIDLQRDRTIDKILN